MRVKDTYFIKLFDDLRPEVSGIGECALFKGLSADDVPQFEDALSAACNNPSGKLPEMSAIRFGFETAEADLKNGGRRVLYDTPWTNGDSAIGINGLIWMGDKPTMMKRIEDKIEKGFRILKLKIGGIDFNEELSIIGSIRKRFNSDDLEIRLDANGNFSPDDAMRRLTDLSVYGIHSIEQPIAARQPELMGELCRRTPIPIALDEELIGWKNDEEISSLLSYIKPQYIILKPSLCGGFERADKWIDNAETMNIGWWATSALESNIGLNAIAQWVSTKDNKMVQGLGTGELYENNIASPLAMEGAQLVYHTDGKWDIPELPWRR